MKKLVKWLVLPAAMMGMGIALPSCPGQKEAMDQISALQVQNGALTKKLNDLTSQMAALNTDMAKVKDILPQMTRVIEAQKVTVDAMEHRLVELETKAAPKGKKKK